MADNKPLLASETLSGSSRSSEKAGGVTRPEPHVRPYSSKTKGWRWIFTILHLLGLWVVMFGLATLVLSLIFSRVETGPLFYGLGSFIGGVPRLFADPLIPVQKLKKMRNRIEFDPSDPNSYSRFLDRYRAIATQWESIDRTNVRPCTKDHHNKTWNEMTDNERDAAGPHDGKRIDYACAFHEKKSLPFAKNKTWCSLEEFAKFPDTDKMGFDIGQPCIMLRFMKILGFYPPPRETGDNKIDEKLKKVKPLCYEADKNSTVKIECTLKSNGKELPLDMGDGMSHCSFPFWNQTGYQQPYIMLRPRDPLPDGSSELECNPVNKRLMKLSDGRDNVAKITFTVGKDWNKEA